MRNSLHHFAAIAIVLGWTISMGAQEVGAAAPASPTIQPLREEPITNPVADPKAVVTLGKARFTVLTPELIRMEWAADGKFEDHASFVFLNRRMPVPKFSHKVGTDGRELTIQTDAVSLTYMPDADGKFTPDNLKIELTVDGKPVVWHPGDSDPENLQGTTRTLDGALAGS